MKQHKLKYKSQTNILNYKVVWHKPDFLVFPNLGGAFLYEKFSTTEIKDKYYYDFKS